MTLNETWRMLRAAITVLYSATAIGLVALMALSFLIGGYVVFGTNLGEDTLNTLLPQLSIFFLGLPVTFPIAITYGSLFIGLWIIYLSLFITALTGPRSSIIDVFRGLKKEGYRKAFQNTALTVATTFSALMVATTIIECLQSSVGVPTGSLPEEDPIVAYVFISLAPLVEEVGFRLTLIGFIASLITVDRGYSWGALKAFWYPGRYIRMKRRVRQRTGTSLINIVGEESKTYSPIRMLYTAAAVSAVFFGFAHILYGGGWEIGKVTTSTLAGFALGWIYIEYGFPAAVLLHWSFNYFSSSFYYFTQAVGENIILHLYNTLLMITGVLSLIILFLILYKRNQGWSVLKTLQPYSTPLNQDI